MNWNDIPQFIDCGSSTTNVFWKYLEAHLETITHKGQLDLDPPFQRGHVWTEEQQVRYCEYILKGGHSSKDIWLNCPGWNRMSNDQTVTLVDGKQRLNAVLRFLHDEIRVFKNMDTEHGTGFLMSEMEGKMPLLGLDFVFHVNTLQTDKEVMQWYLDLNEGGTPHTKEELEKVKEMIGEI